jgi:hypothetical protein
MKALNSPPGIPVRRSTFRYSALHGLMQPRYTWGLRYDYGIKCWDAVSFVRMMSVYENSPTRWLLSNFSILD